MWFVKHKEERRLTGTCFRGIQFSACIFIVLQEWKLQIVLTPTMEIIDCPIPPRISESSDPGLYVLYNFLKERQNVFGHAFRHPSSIAQYEQKLKKNSY